MATALTFVPLVVLVACVNDVSSIRSPASFRAPLPQIAVTLSSADAFPAIVVNSPPATTMVIVVGAEFRR